MKGRLSDHARTRAREMGIGTKLVKRALADPDVIYPSRDPKHPEGSQVAFKDLLAVPFLVDMYDSEMRVAITVLWRSDDPWVRDQEAEAG